MAEKHLYYTDYPMRKILFIVPTQKSEKDGMLPVEEDLEKIVPPLDYQVELLVAYENKLGLSKLYNKEIDRHQGYDWIVFIHDDIRIYDNSIYLKLLDAEKRGWDVVGVAGSKSYQVPHPEIPTGWWSAQNKANGLAGFVAHNIDGKIGMSVFGPAPQRVLVIDGVFIAVSRRAIETGLRFDDAFNWNHYDMALCLNAYKKGLAVGVEPIYIEHRSPGAGFRSPEFLKSQMLLCDKYFRGNYPRQGEDIGLCVNIPYN